MPCFCCCSLCFLLDFRIYAISFTCSTMLKICPPAPQNIYKWNETEVKKISSNKRTDTHRRNPTKMTFLLSFQSIWKCEGKPKWYTIWSTKRRDQKNGTDKNFELGINETCVDTISIKIETCYFIMDVVSTIKCIFLVGVFFIPLVDACSIMALAAIFSSINSWVSSNFFVIVCRSRRLWQFHESIDVHTRIYIFSYESLINT